MNAQKRFKKTPKQKEACDVLNGYRHALLYGGSRSTKTTIAVRNIILRAVKKPSRHLITRSHFNHAKTAIWYDTFPKTAKGFFPDLKIHENKSDWFWTVPTKCGGESTIWLGGTDNKERADKILGNEYSTIFANECSLITYDTVTTLRTRLAENSGLNLRFYYDLNPCGKRHWTYKEFIEKINPEDSSKSKLNSNYLVMNPMDNPHLPPEVIEELKALPKRKRQRFLEGLYLSDVEGALWTDEMVSMAAAKSHGHIKHVVIAVDPAVTNQEDSDETGIVVCGIDENDEGVIIDDLSLKASTDTWAQRVVNIYNNIGANEVVVEVNQGGDLVEDVLKNKDKSIKVTKVRASKGKFARAEPISALYEQGKVAHVKEMPDLETQLTEYVPLNSKKSPDRLDALVWGLTRLMLKPQTRIQVA